MRTLGSDPEVFLVNAKQKPVIATGYVGGTKKKPIAVRFGGLQEDNVAAEFNTDPASTEDEWVRNHMEVMDQLAGKVAKKGLRIHIRNAMKFKIADLEKDPKAMEFGCDPSFDAWNNGAVIEPPDPYTDTRTCGGHIHIGDKRLTNQDKAMHAVRLLSILVLPLMRRVEPDVERHGAYGRPGAFRMKPYGVEWRAPSNVWLRSEASMRWVWQAVNAVLDSPAMNNNKFFNTNDFYESQYLRNPYGVTARDIDANMQLNSFMKKAKVQIGEMPV